VHINIYILKSEASVCATEVRALYGRLRLAARGLRVATLAMVGSGRGWLGTVVARRAAECNDGVKYGTERGDHYTSCVPTSDN